MALSLDEEIAKLQAEIQASEKTPGKSGSLSLDDQIAQLEAELTPKEKEKEPWYEDFGEGLAVSGMSTYFGIKDLFGAMSDDNRATLEDWRKDASESGWGTAGQVVGDIGQMAIPGGALTKGLKGASKLKKFMKAKDLDKYAPIAADAAVSAAHGALSAPKEGETRLQGALKGLGGAVTGGLGGAVLNKAIKGIRRTPEAEALIKKGIELTPGQAAEGAFPRMLESAMEWGAFTRKGTKNAQNKALQQWNNRVLKEAAPPGSASKITGIGHTGNTQLKDAFDDAYKAAWAKADKPNSGELVSLINNAVRKGQRLDDGSQRVIANVLDDVNQLSRDYSPQRLRALDNTLRKRVSQAMSGQNTNFDLGSVLKDMRASLRKSVGPDVQSELSKIDAKYGKYLTVRQSANLLDAATQGGKISPKQLMQGAKSIGSKNDVFTGSAPFQDLAAQGLATVGRKNPQPLLNTRKALINQAPEFWLPLLNMTTGGKAMLGQTGAQTGAGAIADILRNMGVTSRVAGAAIAQEDLE